MVVDESEAQNRQTADADGDAQPSEFFTYCIGAYICVRVSSVNERPTKNPSTGEAGAADVGRVGWRVPAAIEHTHTHTSLLHLLQYGMEAWRASANRAGEFGEMGSP